MSKETFIIRTEWYEAIAELDANDQATILRNLFAYHLNEEVTLDTFGVKIVWKLIEPTLSRNMDAFDRKVQTNRENGKLGGRPATKTKTETQMNPNNQTVITPITQTKPITLSDNDSEYDNEYDSESESDHVAKIPTPTPIEKLKQYSDQALTPPGTDTAHQQYYETEICHRHGFDIDTVRDIHTAWVGDRLGHMFTMQEARQNFSSYCAKWKQNNRLRSSTQSTYKSSSPQPTKTINYAPSG